MQDNPDLFIFYFTIYTGLRAGEISALKSNNINLDNNIILINRSYDYKHKEIKSVKNGEERTIPIFNNILHFINKLDLKNNKYVFHQENGNIMTYDVLKRKFKKLKTIVQKNIY